MSLNPITTTLMPREIADSYGTDDVTFGKTGSAGTVDGGGETIAIIEYGDDTNLVNTTDSKATSLYPITFAGSDLNLFDNQYSVGADFNFTVVGETGGARPNFKMDPSANPADDDQIALDVEWRHVNAPRANIVLIETTTESDADFATAATAGVAAVGARSCC